MRKATAKAVTQVLYEEIVTRFGCPKHSPASTITIRHQYRPPGLLQMHARNFETELEVPKALYLTTPPPGQEGSDEVGQSETNQHTERLKRLQDTLQLVRVSFRR